MSSKKDRRWGVRNPAKGSRPVHPGETLQEEYLRPQQLDPRALAPRVGILTDQLLDLLDGRSRVTPELADKLGLEFKTSAAMWLNLQAEWDAWERRQHP